MKVPELREHADELSFEPQDSVRWLSPTELWRAAVKVVLSSVFASYADKRESQAGLPAEPMSLADAPGNELWLDFVADLGDGFDATYTVASLLAAEKLEPEPASDDDRVAPLPRAALLVLGGDEVYPTASAREYDNRTRGPYRAALPAAADGPLLVALPGNHDWYDGLTSFLRLFTQGRVIGGWRTRQTRSYFAVQLPNRWWLLGLDTQFGNDLDDPQLKYFEEHVSKHLQAGDSVILCAAQPTWVQTAEKRDCDAFNSLHWFDRQIVRTKPDGEGGRVPTGAGVRLWITGDSHHYARFAARLDDDPPAPARTPAQEAGAEPTLRPDPRRRQMVTCGLGGAYLSATHNLPETLPLPPKGSRLRDKDESVDFARSDVCYPDRTTSRRWSRRLAYPWSPYWLPRRNPGFGTVAAGVHVVLFLALAFALGLATDQGPVRALRYATLVDARDLCAQVFATAFVVLLVPWAVRRLRAGRWKTPSTAVAAALLQLLVAEAALLAAVAVPVPEVLPGWTVLALGCLLAAAVGWVLGSEAFALYVLLARAGQAFGWQMSGQAVEDQKGFVRMHLDTTGTLTLYPLVVDEVCRDWELDDDPVAAGKRPVFAGPAPVVRLLEDPVVIARMEKAP